MKIVKKPWGAEKHFIFNKKCSVKILRVKPKGILSLQKHKKRKEIVPIVCSLYCSAKTQHRNSLSVEVG